jgi:hypothetical protein
MRNFSYLESRSMPAEVHVGDTLIYMQQCFMSHCTVIHCVIRKSLEVPLLITSVVLRTMLCN